MMVSVGQFFFRFRNYLFPLALPLIFVPGPPVIDSPLAAPLLGLAIALLGQMVRVGTIGLEYIIRGGRNRRVYAEKLVTDGVYAHSRNPMYVGNLLLIIGICVTSNSWGCVGIAVPFFTFAYLAITAAEEDYLRRNFGEAYEQYCRDVPRFLPKLSGLAGTFRDSKFHWRRVLAKEYGTMANWPLRWMLVFGWSLWRDGHDAQLSAGWPVFTLAALALAVFYFSIRSLKKSRQLVAD
jgi:protein-S-isoprenylcysteine O-methyltransferase Ste14